MAEDIADFFCSADWCVRRGSPAEMLQAVKAFRPLAFPDESAEAKQFWDRLMVAASRASHVRLAMGRLRSVWGTTPIASLRHVTRADKMAGVEAVSLVFTQYYTTSDFDINLSRIQEFILKNDNPLFYAFRRYVHAWSLLAFDIFHLYNDRGLLEPAGGYGSERFGIALSEMQAYRDANKLLFTYAYGADHRLRQRTLASAKFNMCMDCPAPGRFCLCDDEGGLQTLETIGRYATRMVGYGLSIDYLPNPYFMRYLIVDVADLLPRAKPSDHSDPVLRVGHFPNHDHFKGTRYLVSAIDELKRQDRAIELVKLSGLPRREILDQMTKVDVVVDQLISGAFGLTAIEAMALGVPVIANIRPGLRIPSPQECPIIKADPETIGQVLDQLSKDRAPLIEAAARGPEYVKKHASIEALATDLRQLYKAMLPRRLGSAAIALGASRIAEAGRRWASMGRRVAKRLGDLAERYARAAPAARRAWILRRLRREAGRVLSLFMPTTLRIYLGTAEKIVSGAYALELRQRLNPLVREKRNASSQNAAFHGLYATVQPTVLSSDLKALGWHSVYEAFDYNPAFVAPDVVRNDVFHPDFYFEHVSFDRVGIEPRRPPVTDTFNLDNLERYFMSKWGRYDVYHFNWFLSFLPDNLDVEYLRKSGSSVYFHWRGCFILTKLAPEFAAQGKSVADACAACKARGWRREYFRRFQRGVREANRVFVSTPNLCHCSPDFEYLPLSLDAETAALRPEVENPTKGGGPVVVMHAPSSAAMENVKGTKHVVAAIEQLQREGFDIELVMVQNLERREAIRKFGQADIFVEQLTLGSYGNTAIEAMAQGVPVISSHHPDHAHLVPGCPVVHADPTTIADRLRDLLRDDDARLALGRRCAAFVREFHNHSHIAGHVSRLYREDLGHLHTRAPNKLDNQEPYYGP
ncbi:glycosyltransferase [Bradyrhizobium sp. CER78]|uniref:glycosyltransferase n=1 Tax=Bradyrhizobium sp. CER78 TaxID=3039162 RepID=UPI002449AC96|nr:glycosyltransferase [Bradyrhizobium sp. CER78]MDH2382196.1 glycosyltransferase [Bradyrhizobium sp. CER78]